MFRRLAQMLLLSIIMTQISIPLTLAQTNNDFEIIPKASDDGTVEKAVNDVSNAGGSVRDIYNKKAKDMENNLGNQMASGIMTRDTLLDYIVYGVRFLSQIGLVIGGFMVIYAGYIYASSVFSGGNASKGNDAIQNAITGILVIAFSYAIMKLLTSAFIS